MCLVLVAYNRNLVGPDNRDRTITMDLAIEYNSDKGVIWLIGTFFVLISSTHDLYT